jgi:hypothetical protein
MVYVMAVVAILAIAFVVWRVRLIGVKPRSGTADEDATDRRPRPPSDPDRPVPGSAPHRHDQGQP